MIAQCSVDAPLQPPCAATETVTLTKTDLTCAGFCNGSVTATLNGAGWSTSIRVHWNGRPAFPDALKASNVCAGVYNVNVEDLVNGCCQDATAAVTVGAPPALTLALALVLNPSGFTGVTCNGGNDGVFTATITGGTPPYDVFWSGGAPMPDQTPSGVVLTFPGLTAGSYAVVVVDDNGCTASRFINVPQPVALTFSVAATEITCFDADNGAVQVNTTGGTPLFAGGYNFRIDGGAFTPFPNPHAFSGLTPGNHSFEVQDARGCIAGPTLVALIEPTEITFDLLITPPSCAGLAQGTVRITPRGGRPPYDFRFTGGVDLVTDALTFTFTGLPAGPLPSITVEDATGCEVNRGGIIIPAVTPVTATAAVTTQIACNGGSTGVITMTAAGGAGSNVSDYAYSLVPTGNPPAFRSSNIFNNLPAGTYNFQAVDANGCTSAVGVIVLNPATTITPGGPLVVTNNGCFGVNDGSIRVPPGITGGAPIGGIPGMYQFSIDGGSFTAPALDNTFNNLAPGQHTVTIRDQNQCTFTYPSVNLTQTTPVTFTAVQQAAITCSGANNGVIRVTPTGGTAPFIITMDGGASMLTSAAIGVFVDFGGLGPGTHTFSVTGAGGACPAAAPAFVTLLEPHPLTVAVEVTQIVNCNRGDSFNPADGGTARASVSGGTLPYTVFNWTVPATNPPPTVGPILGATNTASNLLGGTHTVQVTDSRGCASNLLTFTLAEPPPVNARFATSDVKCNGENSSTILVLPSGGTSLYTFSWALSPTPVPAAQINNQFLTGLGWGPAPLSVNYGVRIFYDGARTFTGDATAPQCRNDFLVTLNQPTAIDPNAALGKAVACFGGNDGEATSIPTGGVPPYSFLWTSGEQTPTAKRLTAGTHSVLVSDANKCSAQEDVIITQPTSKLTAAYVATNTTCLPTGGSIKMNPTGGTPPYQSFRINGGGPTGIPPNFTVNNLAPGNYSMAIIDNNGCATDAEIVTVPSCTPPLPPVPPAPPAVISCGKSGRIVVCRAGTCLCTNKFKAGDIFGLCAGGCKAVIGDDEYLTDDKGLTYLNAFPNPFKDKITIEFIPLTDDHFTLAIFNMQGQLMSTMFDGHAQQGQLYSFDYDAGSAAEGLYFYRLQSESGEMLVRKIIMSRQ